MFLLPFTVVVHGVVTRSADARHLDEVVPVRLLPSPTPPPPRHSRARPSGAQARRGRHAQSGARIRKVSIVNTGCLKGPKKCSKTGNQKVAYLI